jgi:hypothetical protein
MFQLLKTPIYDDFFSLISSSKTAIKLCSPFIKGDITNEIIEKTNNNCHLTVITNVNLMSLCKKASDISAISAILESGGDVFNYQKLHAKIYIFDNTKAIITSANLTQSGLKRNYEYGVLCEDITLVNQVCSDYASLCSSELTGKLKPEHIAKIQNILDLIPPREEVKLPKLSLEYEDTSEDIFDKDISIVIKNLTGWRRSVFSSLSLIDKQVFNTHDFRLIIPHLYKLYPHNNNIDAKIRQQLQQLRDLGLIKFEGNGVYKKLWI